MPPAAIAGAGARDGDNSGLGEPLLGNGGGGGGGGTVANGRGHGAEPVAEKKQSAEDKYWVDIDQPEALEPADVESGGGGGRRPLLFRNKRVKRSIMYPYRFGRLSIFTAPVHIPGLLY